MTTLKHLRRFLPQSSCTRFSSHVNTLNKISEPVSKPKSTEVLPVQTLDHIHNRGEHYQRSYKQFTSWLNSGGHAEVFEGCVVVGKVIKVISREGIERQRVPAKSSQIQIKIEDLLQRRNNCQVPRKVAWLEEQIAVRQEKLQKLESKSREVQFELDKNTENVLVIDWGHKHLGYAPLDRYQVCPRHSEYVACRLKEFEIATQTMGFPVYERHNEARLEYIRPVRLHADSRVLRSTVFPNVYIDGDISVPICDIYIKECYASLFTEEENAILNQIRENSDVKLKLYTGDETGIDGKLRLKVKSTTLDNVYAAVSMINNKIELYEKSNTVSLGIGNVKKDGSSGIGNTQDEAELIKVYDSDPTTLDDIHVSVDMINNKLEINEESKEIESVDAKEEYSHVHLKTTEPVKIENHETDVNLVDPVPKREEADNLETLQNHLYIFVDKRDYFLSTKAQDIFIEKRYIPQFIGRNAASIKNITEKSKTDVQLSSDDESVINGKSKITINGENKASISQAVDMINQHIEKYEKAYTLNTRRGKQEITDGKEDYSDSNSTDKLHLKLLQDYTYIYIDKYVTVDKDVAVKTQDIYINNQYTGVVIGSKGSTINSIRKESSAQINVTETLFEEKRKVTIKSESEAMYLQPYA